jgi:ribosomal subunit interface protein
LDIVVKGRNVEVPDHYRSHVGEKLRKIERYDHKLIRADIELFHEPNPRQADHCQRVEITCYSRGPVVRAEATADDFYAAFDCAIAKLDNRLRRSADRRRVHRGRRAPLSVAAATAGLRPELLPALSANGNAGPATVLDESTGAEMATESDVAGDTGAGGEDEASDYQPWRIARRKEHDAEPMTVEDALFEMELVGHDFYLFLDKETGRPSVVYRRKGFDYGLINIAV